MASNTENLNLLMKNPSTDGADTFNVQTMLNDNWQKIDNNAGTVAQTLSNILKPTTPPLIGLPPSTTPDGMFQALGNTGELHVWRKTVKNAEDVPAGYTLGEVQNVTKYPITNIRSGGHTIVTKAYSNLSVDDAGNVSVDESSYVNFYDDASAVRGKFIQVYSDRDILFIPNDAKISTDYETVGSAVIHNHYTDKYQTVTGYAKVPAGTTTTYPVSTNPNAYQEGDDAKEAGYTLGEVVTGKFAVSFYNAAEGYYYKVSESLDVSSSGSVSMPSTSENVLIDYSHNNNTTAVKNKFAGKFVQFLYRNGGDGRKFPDTKPPFNGYDIVYIPDNVSVTQEKVISNNDFVIDRYQPVTGYAAIPAGTTIEYLGKLGDKARVQVISYVGTGTYGEKNPTVIEFDIVPKIFFIGANQNSSEHGNVAVSGCGWVNSKQFTGTTAKPGYIKFNGKKISMFSASSSAGSYNTSGWKYIAIAIS